jgi:hypothetical protein
MVVIVVGVDMAVSTRVAKSM